MAGEGWPHQEEKGRKKKKKEQTKKKKKLLKNKNVYVNASRTT